jgi:RNA polymerase subunit RPABC4/transcription elongation factor Spt4
MMGRTGEANEYLSAVTGEYTPALQRFVDSIYLLLEPKVAKEMGADENTCAFYLVNFFGQKDPKAKAEEERLKREAAERRRKEIEEQKRKAEEAARKKAEEEQHRKEVEAAERRRQEEERKRQAEEAARKKAEEERRRKEEEEQQRKKASWMVVCDHCGKSVSNSEAHCPCCGSILKSIATARSMIICEECGSPVDSSNKLCPYCGSNLKGHEYVDLGLPSGTLWATCNIGASKPEEFGNYFAWGETSGYNEGKRIFDDEHYKFRIKKKSMSGSKWIYTKYCDNKNNGEVDNKLSLDKEDDAAYVQWGKGWRMPTTAQFEELINKEYTTQELISKSGVKGLLITSKANGNSIFIPEAGHHGYDVTNGYSGEIERKSHYYKNSGNYWTKDRLSGTYNETYIFKNSNGKISTKDGRNIHYYDDTANSLSFFWSDMFDKGLSCYVDENKNNDVDKGHRSRCEGKSIRPVHIEE